MSDTEEQTGSMLDKFTEIIHHHEVSSSSSDSESENYLPSRKKHLFGRKQPVHKVLGGGKAADIVLWREKQISGSILAGVTVLWLLFEWIGYHLLTFICHGLIVGLAILFLWSNLAAFAKRTPPKFPEVILPEELFVNIALSLRSEINQAFIAFKKIASGNDFKNFVVVIGVLWVISVIGSWFNFLTLFYLVFVMVYTIPVMYEKNEEQVDIFGEKALVELNKQYAVFDEKVLQKLPKYPFNNDKKLH